jgi:uncharacterized protein (DUF1501 family)
MKRRTFLKKSAGAVVIPSLLNGFGVKAYAEPMLNRMFNPGSTATDHVLVLIQLNGGNDGLNTVVPLDQYAALSQVRNHVLLPDTSVLPLNGVSGTGLHPAMTGIKELFDDGLAQIIQSVGYPNPDYSHFRSTDIWMSAADSNQVIPSGWAGRYLNYEYPNFPTGYPNTDMPDPLAIEIGYAASLTFMGPTYGMGMAISDPASIYSLVNQTQSPVPNTPAGEKLQYVRDIANQSRYYGQAVTTAYNTVVSQLPYPANNELAEKLRIVARLIAGGLKTRIYLVSLNGFDTHASQVEVNDHTTGTHATLLSTLSESVKAFMDDLSHLGIEQRVVAMTFSEFGRRIIDNASFGTDHGAAAPMFVFGHKVQGGILGNNPTISSQAGANDNLPMQYDFRSVYASILQDWFCVPPNEVDNIMLQAFQQLPVVQAGTACLSATHEINQQAGRSMLECYPNPFTDIANIKYQTDGGYTMVQIFSAEGQLLATPVNGELSPGAYQCYWNSEDLPTGAYYVRLQNGPIQQVKGMIKVRS